MRKILLPLFSFLIFLSACKQSTEPQAPEQKPPGYQENIPWPSLADSPWPMYRHDPQNSGRSDLLGPSAGIIADTIKAKSIEAGIVLGKNNVVYFNDINDGKIHSYSDSDSLLWEEKIGHYLNCAPLVDKNGDVYVLSDFSLTKFNANGEKLWQHQFSKPYFLSEALVIDKNSNVILVDTSKTIFSFSKDGNLNWSYKEERLGMFNSPAFSPDGNVLYLQGKEVSLIAFDITKQSVLWTFGETPLLSAPLVDSQGNIYIAPSNKEQTAVTLYSLTKEATIRWKINFTGKYPATNGGYMCMDTEGNISIVLSDTLYNISYEGKINWKNYLGTNINDDSPIVDREGNVYVVLIHEVASYNKTGNLRWRIPIEEAYILYSPAIGENGKLIVSSFDGGNIYIIK